MRLYELTGKYLALYELIEAQAGELSEELEAALGQLEGEIEEKLEKCGHVIKNLEGESEIFLSRAKVYIDEGKRFKDKADRLAAECARIKTYVLSQLEALGEKKKKTASFSYSIRESQAVQLLDESLLPSEFIDYEPKIRKADISKELKAGIAVPGASLQINKSLQIK